MHHFVRHLYRDTGYLGGVSEKEEQTREYLYKATGREFRKPKSLAHTSDIVFHLREEIARKAKYRLVNAATGEPLRVVEHIGCHYAKIFPKAGIGGSNFLMCSPV